MEKWVPCVIEGYEISNIGNAKRVDSYIDDGKGFKRFVPEKEKTKLKHTGGYVQFCMSSKKYLAHRLVFESFVGKIPKGMEINHINGIKTDNRLENLECVTPKQNIHHAMKLGIFINENRNVSKGSSHSKTKLTEKDVVHLRRLFWETDMEPSYIADIYRISKGCVFDISKMRTWKHVAHPYPMNRVFNNRWGSKIIKNQN